MKLFIVFVFYVVCACAGGAKYQITPGPMPEWTANVAGWDDTTYFYATGYSMRSPGESGEKCLERALTQARGKIVELRAAMGTADLRSVKETETIGTYFAENGCYTWLRFLKPRGEVIEPELNIEEE